MGGHDVFLQDVSRIEIVRGPGGTLWGANAVNGVVNIESKTAQDTQGWLTQAGGGNQEKAFAGARYGGSWGPRGFYRAWAHAYDRAALGGGDNSSGSQSARAGFRSDFGAGATQYMVSGKAYRTWGGRNLLVTVPTSSLPLRRRGIVLYSGAALTSRLIHQFPNNGSIRSQLSIDTLSRDSRVENIRGFSRTLDADFQHSIRPWKRHQWIWGLGYRLIWDRVEPGFLARLTPASYMRSLVNLFAQDEIELVADHFWLIAGTKIERNASTGFEHQPSIRASWKPTDKQLAWAAVSRAIRTPARIESDATVILVNPQGPPARIVGSAELPVETLYAYEVGYRAHMFEKATFDAASYYFDYRRLHAFEFEGLDVRTMPETLRFKQGVLGGARSYGGELSVVLDLGHDVYLRPSYSFLEMNARPRSNIFRVAAETIEGQSPKHQAALRSGWKVTEQWRADAGLFFVSR